MKKRVLSLFLVLALALCLLPSGALAEEEPAPSPSATAEPVYGDPYVVNYTVQNGSGQGVNEWLRDFNNDSVPTNTVKVTVCDPRLAGLAEGETRTVRAVSRETEGFSCVAALGTDGQELTVNRDTGTYELSFGGVKYYGSGNSFVFDLSYTSGSLPMQTLTVAVAACRTIDKRPEVTATPSPTPTPEPTSTPEPTYRTPNLIVKSSGYGSATLAAGQEFTLSLSIMATTGTENLADTLVSLTLPEGVSLAGGNQTAYVGALAPGAVQSVSFRLKSLATFTGGVANVGIALSGVGQMSGAAAGSTTTVSVPIVQPERFEITKVEGADMLYMGESGSVTVTFVNKGKNPVSNLSAEITGTNLANPGQSQFLGNLSAGTENSVDFDLEAQNAGTMNCTILLTYEDNEGSQQTLTKEFSCTVQEMEPVFDPAFEDMPVEQPSQGMPWWGILLLIVAVLGAGAGVFVFLRRRKKKKQSAMERLEDEDEDL